MKRTTDPEQALDLFVQNAQKGEPYRIKFHEDSIVYDGIPVAPPEEAAGAEGTFRFEITAPKERAGLVQRRLRDIEWVDRVR